MTLQPRTGYCDPTLGPHPKEAGTNLWLYRRIANRQNFAPGAYASDISAGELAAERLLARAR